MLYIKTRLYLDAKQNIRNRQLQSNEKEFMVPSIRYNIIITIKHLSIKRLNKMQ